MSTELRSQLEQYQTTLANRQADLAKYEAQLGKVDIVMEEKKADGTLDEEFKANRKKLSRKCATLRSRVKASEKTISEFMAAHPELGMSIAEESETEALEELEALSTPATETEAKARAVETSGFSIPTEVKEAPVVEEVTLVETVAPVEDTPTEENATETVEESEAVETAETESVTIEEAPTEEKPVAVTEDFIVNSSYYEWIKGEGLEWINQGLSINTIAGRLIHKFNYDAYLPDVKNQLLSEALSLFPGDLWEQVRHIYMRLDC